MKNKIDFVHPRKNTTIKKKISTVVPTRRSSRQASFQAKKAISKVFSHPSHHRINEDCQLHNGGCCYMQDKRPKHYPLFNASKVPYPYFAYNETYVDGVGAVNQRSYCYVNYCPSCVDFWKCALKN